VPIIVQGVVNYNTVIAVNNPELTLRPGMTATVAILVARREQALKIPKAALRFQPKLSEEAREDLERYVRARRDGGARDEPVPVSDAQRKREESRPMVWILTPQGFLRPAVVRLGISDDQFTELIGGGLREGQEVVIGVMDKDGRGGRGASLEIVAPRSRQAGSLREVSGTVPEKSSAAAGAASGPPAPQTIPKLSLRDFW
jgi:HlyD family secretion protein